MAKYVTIKTFVTRLEAEVAKSFLDANGIKAVIIADDAGGARPFPLSYSPNVFLQVSEADAKEASQLLEDVQAED